MFMASNLPSLHALRAFEAAARLQSVSQAGTELHVTHGAISRQIHALEAELGIPLFVREGRGLGLTAAGHRLREQATRTFDDLRQCCHQLRHEAGLAPVVMGCPSSVLARWIIPRLERLQQDLPQLTLHLSTMQELPTAALPGLDAALLLASPPWPAAWQVYPLAPECIGPVFSPQHPHAEALADGDLHALYRESLLVTESRPQAWPDWAAARNMDPTHLHYGRSFAHLYYLLEAAVAGLGVAIAPQPLVAEDLAAGRLLAPWGFHDTRAQWVLCLPQRTASPRMEALATWLQHQLQQNR